MSYMKTYKKHLMSYNQILSYRNDLIRDYAAATVKCNNGDMHDIGMKLVAVNTIMNKHKQESEIQKIVFYELGCINLSVDRPTDDFVF